jgi:hypothetical protein
MNVLITDWALQSYLDLKHGQTFSPQEYLTIIRPDVERLHMFPTDPRFGVSNFWGPATDKSGNVIPCGYKMKWHNVGNGRVQLRLLVAIVNGTALLCRAYVKSSEAVDKRECVKLIGHINRISSGQFVIRGAL